MSIYAAVSHQKVLCMPLTRKPSLVCLELIFHHISLGRHKNWATVRTKPVCVYIHSRKAWDNAAEKELECSEYFTSQRHKDKELGDEKSPKHQSDTWVRESISCLCVWICGGTQRHTPVQANQEVRAGFDIDECHPLLSVLSVLEAQRKLSTAFLFSRKNLISIQHASPAHCIQSRALTIQSEHLWLCVCV